MSVNEHARQRLVQPVWYFGIHDVRNLQEHTMIKRLPKNKEVTLGWENEHVFALTYDRQLTLELSGVCGGACFCGSKNR